MQAERVEIRSRGASPRVPTGAGLPWAILAVGALAHTAWFIERGSLWLDEAFLALNILHRSPVELLERLSFNQGAPWGFLLAEKFAVVTLGVSDRSLRLVPLLAALAALPVFWRVASFYLHRSGLLLALPLFCFSPLLVLYSAEVKQYSLDVLAALLALWLAHSARALPDWRRAAAVGVAGAVLLWFSHASLMVLGAGGLAVGVAALVRREWPALRLLAIVGSAWGASAGAFFLFAWPQLDELRDFLSRETYAVAFPPTNGAEVELLARRVRDIVDVPFGFYGQPWSSLISVSAVLLAFVGAVSIARRDRLGAAVLIAPLVGAGAALASGLYPFSPRFVLFLAPLIMLLVALGAEGALRRLAEPGAVRRVAGASGVAAAAFLLVMTAWSTERILVREGEGQDIRPVLEHLRSVWRPGDALYLHAASQYPARYYAEVGGVNRSSSGDTLWPVVPTSGTAHTAPALRSALPTLVVGRFRPDGSSTFTRDLTALEGRKRVWFVFTHVVRFERSDLVDDLDRHIAILDAAGQRRAMIRRGRAVALLYDLRG